MTILRAAQVLFGGYLREFPTKILLACSLILILVTPVLGVEKQSESRATAMSMLKDRDLHKQSTLRFSKVYSYVAGLDTGELLGVLSSVAGKSGTGISQRVRNELQVALLQKLTNHDPVEALEFVKSTNDSASGMYLQSIFEVWATFDLGSAIDHARKLDRRSKIPAMLGLLDAQIEGDLSGVLDIGRELDLNDVSVARVFVDWLNAESVQDPKDMWIRLYTIAENSRMPGIGRQLESLAFQWYQAEGISVLDEIRAQSKKDASSSLRRILLHIALENPGFALNYVLKLPIRHYSLEEELIRTWAEANLQSALEATYTVRDDRIRRDLQQEIASVWAEKEPRYLLQNLDALPEPVRYVAARAGVAEIAKISLQEAGEYALQIEDLKLRSMAVSWLIPIWSTHEPSTLLDWVLNDPVNQPIVMELRNQLVSRSLDSDPKGAFQIALGVPSSQWDGGSAYILKDLPPDLQYSLPPSDELVAEVMDSIGMSDPQLALALLSVVKEGDTKFVAALHLGEALVFQGNVSDALQLAHQLPETHRDRYYSRLASNWSHEDPVSLIESIDEFPSAKHKSSVAARLLRADRRRNAFNEAQVDSLRQHLSESDKNWVDWY